MSMFVDIHHHLIYGVDDGPQTPEQTAAMLKAAARQKVEVILATSHAEPGRHMFDMPAYERHFRETEQMIGDMGLNIRLYRGQEILYSDMTPRMLRAGELLTLAGSRYVLVEFLPDDSYAQLENAARRISNEGFYPIFAHVERYQCLRKIEHVKQLHDEYEVLMQINARTIFNKQDFFTRRWLRKMFDGDYVDFTATDSHNTQSRKCCMKEAYDVLKDLYGDERAEKLTGGTAREMLRI